MGRKQEIGLVTQQDHAAAVRRREPDQAESELDNLIRELTTLHSDLLALEIEGMAQATNIHASYQQSAKNLLHYLALRRHDIRRLKDRLSALGLSSLGRSESHVRATVEALMRVLYRLDRRGGHALQHQEQALSFAEGKALLTQHTEALLGPEPAHRRVRIMVTMPSEAADDPALVRALLESGMDCARINCAHDDVRAGERIWLDDGKIGGTIEAVEPGEIHVGITHARARGEKLRADKGINLPDSSLRLPALTQKDIADLPFVAAHADMVGYSFVRTAADVYELEAHLARVGGEHLGIVLKIETRRAFEQLPNLILAAMRTPRDGVMIARGDLAIECGYERMAEVQEEILWVCEAAHVPVIWATQVLEGLAKDGHPSRAEISDAAIGQRANA